MNAVMLVVGLVAGLWLSGAAASKVMKRSNSRSFTVLAGCFVAPFVFVVGVFAAGLFVSAQDLRTGGFMVLGLMAIYGGVFAAVVGGVIASFIAIGMKQHSETIWSSEDGDKRGYRSAEDDQRYG